MKTDTKKKIIAFIEQNGQARVSELQKNLGISTVAIHKQLNQLLTQNHIRKVGKPPLVFYIPSEKNTSEISNSPEANNVRESIPSELFSIIESTFLQITSDGELLAGYRGFLYWLAKYKKNQSPLVLAQEYVRIWAEKEEKKMLTGWFDATIHLQEAHSQVCVDHFLFEEVYSIATFGRTKLARLVMHAKESSNKSLIDQVSNIAKPMIEKIIEYYRIEAIAYIPPTVERPLQFMKELEYQLNFSLPKIELVKVKAKEGSVQRSQKSIKDFSERVSNARDTIFLKNTQENPYSKVLLIDDAAGSGASFNETAKKLKNRGVGHQGIVSFAIVGNLNLKKYAVIQQI